MKKLITICFVIFTFFILCDFNINAYSDSQDNKIVFVDYEDVDSFINDYNDNSIEVLIKFENLLNDEEFSIISNYEYLSNYNIYENIIFTSKMYYNLIDFENDLDEILNLNTINFVECVYIYYHEIISYNDNTTSSTRYSWDQALIDIGLDIAYLNENISTLKIGILEEALVNKNKDYFNKDNIIINDNTTDDINENEYNSYIENVTNDEILHANIVASIIGGKSGILSYESNNMSFTPILYSSSSRFSIIDSLNWFQKNGVKLINISYGLDARKPKQVVYDSIFDYFSNTFDMIFVNSSGNNSESNNSLITSPGKGYNVITVGAMDSNFNVGETSSYFSEYVKPNVVAPGVNLCDLPSGIESYNNGYLNGTSFSTPFVTAIIGLLVNEFGNDVINPSSMQTALSICSTQKIVDDSLWNVKYGFGIINYKNLRDLYLNSNESFIGKTVVDELIEVSIPANSVLKLAVGVNLYIGDDFGQSNNENNYDKLSNCNVNIYNITLNNGLNNYNSDTENNKCFTFLPEEVITADLKSNIYYLKYSNCKDYEQKIVLQIDLVEFYSVDKDKLTLAYMFEDCTADYNSYYHKVYSESFVIDEEHEYIFDEEKASCDKCGYYKMMDEIIITDPDQWTLCGSEVNLKDAEFRGNEITQGFTRMLYFDSNIAPSISRLDYNWDSSNDSHATVSIYGTVTAQIVEEPTWVIITATYKYDPNIVFYKKLYIIPETGDELIIIHKQVTMDADESYSLVLTDEEYPTTRIQNYHWNVPCQADESAGVKISVWGTITASAPGIMYIDGWYELNPCVIISIEVIVT